MIGPIHDAFAEGEEHADQLFVAVDKLSHRGGALPGHGSVAGADRVNLQREHANVSHHRGQRLAKFIGVNCAPRTHQLSSRS